MIDEWLRVYGLAGQRQARGEQNRLVCPAESRYRRDIQLIFGGRVESRCVPVNK